MSMEKDPDLIWIVEAIVETGHSREWFNRRIADGRLKVYHTVGETKVYLRRQELAALELGAGEQKDAQ